MIFRNEKGYIEKAFESVQNLCSEFIFVDSGSTDGSEDFIQDLAKRDPRIIYFKRDWPGDFASQRNFSLSQATQNWILVLDADERLEVSDHSMIQKAILEPIDAYLLEIRNYTQDHSEIGYRDGYVPTHLHRLFKRHEKIKYEGILHERIEPSLEREKLVRASLAAVIHHDGKLKEVAAGLKTQRLEFYEGLARRKVRENPWDAQSHWELGVILQKNKIFSEAEMHFEKALELSPSTEEFEVYYLMCLYQQNAWPRLLKISPKSKRAGFFLALAKAESDETKVSDLLAYQNYFSQAPLMAFEIALRRGYRTQIDPMRAAAQKSWLGKGVVEAVEGSFYRGQQDWEKALPFLESAVKAEYDAAIKDYLICLLKLEKFSDLKKFDQSLDEMRRRSLDEDSTKLLRLGVLKSIN